MDLFDDVTPVIDEPLDDGQWHKTLLSCAVCGAGSELVPEWFNDAAQLEWFFEHEPHVAKLRESWGHLFDPARRR